VTVGIDLLVTTGNLNIITTTEGVATGGVDFEVFAGTCDALLLDFASGVSLGTGTTDEFGELTLTNFAAGEVCVVADLNGDLVIDATDVTADATVEAGVTTDVTVDQLVNTGNVLVVNAQAGADIAVFSGFCGALLTGDPTLIDADLALGASLDDADGTFTVTNVSATEVCAVEGTVDANGVFDTAAVGFDTDDEAIVFGAEVTANLADF
jgi:hypothetical protein